MTTGRGATHFGPRMLTILGAGTAMHVNTAYKTASDTSANVLLLTSVVSNACASTKQRGRFYGLTIIRHARLSQPACVVLYARKMPKKPADMMATLSV